jgi:hypothetical protein
VRESAVEKKPEAVCHLHTVMLWRLPVYFFYDGIVRKPG